MNTVSCRIDRVHFVFLEYVQGSCFPEVALADAVDRLWWQMA